LPREADACVEHGAIRVIAKGPAQSSREKSIVLYGDRLNAEPVSDPRRSARSIFKIQSRCAQLFEETLFRRFIEVRLSGYYEASYVLRDVEAD
jgi:hypothetical protein